MSIVNSTHREADESMKNKKPNYEKGLKVVSGISGVLELLFLLISCYIVMAQWESGKLIVCVILAGIFCNVILLIFLAKKWREQFRGIMAEFRKMYSDLLQLPSPCIKEKSVLNELSDMIDYLEKGLDKALISSLALKQAEINVLQSQINPHFLYNILDSIRGQALSEGVPEIADMTESLANYFRYCVTKDDGIVTLADELKNVQNYWKIQQYRFGGKISMEILLDGTSLYPEEYEIPKLILQPIVENAIFHGLETKTGKGHVVIRIENTSTLLMITVMDDGTGMDEEELEKLRTHLKEKQHVIGKNQYGTQRNSGIALLNVNERIKLHYGDEYGLQISSSRLVGTEVEFILPVKSPVYK